jgi:hypothetical protein
LQRRRETRDERWRCSAAVGALKSTLHPHNLTRNDSSLRLSRDARRMGNGLNIVLED